MLKYSTDTCKIYWSTFTDYLHLVTPHPLRSTMCSPPSTHSSILSAPPPPSWFSGGGPWRPDPVPDERSGEAAAAVQSQDPAAGRAQPAELHPGGRAQEATAGQSGAAGLPTEYRAIFFLIHVSCFNCRAAKPNLKPASPVCCSVCIVGCHLALDTKVVKLGRDLLIGLGKTLWPTTFWPFSKSTRELSFLFSFPHILSLNMTF